MYFEHIDLGHREVGHTAVVSFSGNAANIRLLDNPNFQRHQSGNDYRYYGGPAVRSPAEVPIPGNGAWRLVADRQGLDRHSDSGRPIIQAVQVEPRAAWRPLPRYQLPSFASSSRQSRKPRLHPSGSAIQCRNKGMTCSYTTSAKTTKQSRRAAPQPSVKRNCP